MKPLLNYTYTLFAKITKSTMALFTGLLLLSFACTANSFRCQSGHYIKEGMASADVLKQCGKPSSILKKAPEVILNQFTNPLKSYRVWIYRPGTNQYQQYVIIRKKTVIQIIRGERI